VGGPGSSPLHGDGLAGRGVTRAPAAVRIGRWRGEGAARGQDAEGEAAVLP
jgi:hypothetical protein